MYCALTWHDTCDMFNDFFACVFHTGDEPRRPQCPELEDHGRENDKLPVDPKFVWDLLLQLDPHVSIWLYDGIHQRILKELFDVIARPLSIIFEQSCVSGELPADWKLAKTVSMFKKGKKDDPGNYRPISLTSVPGKMMEIILGVLKNTGMTSQPSSQPAQLHESKVLHVQHDYLQGQTG